MCRPVWMECVLHFFSRCSGCARVPWSVTAFDLFGIGQMVASVYGAHADKRAAHNAQQFSERMSSTAYQRAVQDMRAAGLNPALAYQQGGESSPQGVNASYGDRFSEGVASARRLHMEKQLNDAQVRAVTKQGDAAETTANTAARQVWLRENEFNRDTEWLKVSRALEAKERELGITNASISNAVLRKQFEGVKADLEGRKLRGAQVKSLERALERIFGSGKMRDVANILMMMLQGESVSSAVGLASKFMK